MQSLGTLYRQLSPSALGKVWSMDAVLKKGVVLLVVVFVGYYLFTDPNGAAGSAKDTSSAIWSGLVTLFSAIIRFLNALFA